MRIRLSPAFLAIIWCTAASAAPAPTTRPAPKPQPLPQGVKAERNIEYIAGGGSSESLDLYLPEQAGEKPQPLLVWIHGGGWRAGSKAGCRFVPLVKDGYIVASVEYRFSQKALFPAQAQDCQAAIRWLRANAKKYNIDPDHVGIGGDSAGGHLVALLGTSGGKKAFPSIGGNEDQSDRIQAVCDFYGPADFNTVMAQAAEDKNVKSTIKWNTPADPYSSLIGVKLGEDKEKGEAVSPTHYVSKDSAPILILHGDHDKLVPFAQSEELANLLRQDGVEVTLQKLPGSGHGGPAFDLPPVNELIHHFFDKHLKGADVKIEVLPDEAVTVVAMPEVKK